MLGGEATTLYIILLGLERAQTILNTKNYNLEFAIRDIEMCENHCIIDSRLFRRRSHHAFSFLVLVYEYYLVPPFTPDSSHSYNVSLRSPLPSVTITSPSLPP